MGILVRLKRWWRGSSRADVWTEVRPLPRELKMKILRERSRRANEANPLRSVTRRPDNPPTRFVEEDSPLRMYYDMPLFTPLSSPSLIDTSAGIGLPTSEELREGLEKNPIPDLSHLQPIGESILDDYATRPAEASPAESPSSSDSSSGVDIGSGADFGSSSDSSSSDSSSSDSSGGFDGGSSGGSDT